jgi:hypothetical protein
MILSASNTLKPTTTTATLAPYTPQLTCKLPLPRSYDKTHGVRPRRNVRQAMKTEVSMYACVQVRARSVHPTRPPTHRQPDGLSHAPCTSYVRRRTTVASTWRSRTPSTA